MQVVMVRSLYSYVRVLPAYRLYRTCREQRAASFNISYRLSDSLDRTSHHPEIHFERFALSPIETLTGSLKIAVEYQSQYHVAILHAATQSASIPQHIIPDYVRTDGHTTSRTVQKTMSASAYVGTGTPLSPALSGSAAAEVIVGAGYNVLSRVYSAARAGSQRIFAPARHVGSPSSSNPAWIRTAPGWHQSHLPGDWVRTNNLII